MTTGMVVRDFRRVGRGVKERLRTRVGGEPAPLTSATHPSPYPAFCRRAARDDATFAQFKREPAYVKVLEHLTCDQGERYLSRLLVQSPELEPLLPLFQSNDRLGGPRTCDYGRWGMFSPTTLRYAKVLSDLLTLFGPLDGLRIVEIGGGYGGQCLVTSLAAKPKSYTLVDLDAVLDL